MALCRCSRVGMCSREAASGPPGLPASNICNLAVGQHLVVQELQVAIPSAGRLLLPYNDMCTCGRSRPHTHSSCDKNTYSIMLLHCAYQTLCPPFVALALLPKVADQGCGTPVLYMSQYCALRQRSVSLGRVPEQWPERQQRDAHADQQHNNWQHHLVQRLRQKPFSWQRFLIHTVKRQHLHTMSARCLALWIALASRWARHAHRPAACVVQQAVDLDPPLHVPPAAA